MVELNFDANDVEPMGSFEPLPIGEYTVVISSSEMKDAKTGKGQYLQLVYDVVEGEFQNRKLFDRLNIANESSQAQEIAQRALSSICRAVGVMHPKNSEELHDKPFVVRVGIRPAKDEYSASNVIKEYKAVEIATPEKKEEKKAETKSTASPKTKRPWEKK
jgi:hypothetical protein